MNKYFRKMWLIALIAFSQLSYAKVINLRCCSDTTTQYIVDFDGYSIRDIMKDTPISLIPHRDNQLIDTLSSIISQLEVCPIEEISSKGYHWPDVRIQMVVYDFPQGYDVISMGWNYHYNIGVDVNGRLYKPDSLLFHYVHQILEYKQ